MVANGCPWLPDYLYTECGSHVPQQDDHRGRRGGDGGEPQLVKREGEVESGRQSVFLRHGGSGIPSEVYEYDWD